VDDVSKKELLAKIDFFKTQMMELPMAIEDAISPPLWYFLEDLRQACLCMLEIEEDRIEEESHGSEAGNTT